MSGLLGVQAYLLETSLAEQLLSNICSAWDLWLWKWYPLDFFFKCNQIASNDHQYSVNFTITLKAQNTLAQNVHRRLEILLFHKSLSLAPKIYSTLSIYLKKYFYVALVRTSSFHKWLSYWYLHNKSTKGSQKSQLIISLLVCSLVLRQNWQ